MKNNIKIIPWCTMYSFIEVNKDGVISKHVVSNTGWKDLKYWIDYFENEF